VRWDYVHGPIPTALIQGDLSATTNGLGKLFSALFNKTQTSAGLANNSAEALTELLRLANMTPEQRAIIHRMHKNGITIDQVMRINEDQIKEIIRGAGMDPDKDGAPLVIGMTDWIKTYVSVFNGDDVLDRQKKR